MYPRLQPGTVGHWIATATWEEMIDSGLLFEINQQSLTHDNENFGKHRAYIFEMQLAPLYAKVKGEFNNLLEETSRKMRQDGPGMHLEPGLSQLRARAGYSKLLSRVLILPHELILMIYDHILRAKAGATVPGMLIDLTEQELIPLMSKCVGTWIFEQAVYERARFTLSMAQWECGIYGGRKKKDGRRPGFLHHQLDRIRHLTLYDLYVAKNLRQSLETVPVITRCFPCLATIEFDYENPLMRGDGDRARLSYTADVSPSGIETALRLGPFGLRT